MFVAYKRIFYVSPSGETDKIANQILVSLNNDDCERLKSLFSENISKEYDLDKEIEGLFEFVDGEITSYDNFGSGSVSETMNYGKQTFLTISPVIRNVKTDTGEIYVIRFYACLVYEDEEDAIGIVGLKIIAEDGTEYIVGDW